MSNMTTVKTKAKSFWDTKEGTTGMIVGLGLFGALGYGAYKIMPFLANLMENTFYTILFGALSVGLFYALVIDNTLRSRMWLVYKMLMRAITYSIIAYDPVGVLRELQKKAKERIETIAVHRNTVNGQVKQVEETIRGMMRDEKDLITKLEIQRKQGADELEIRSNLSKLGKLQAAVQRLNETYKKVKEFYDQLQRAYKSLVIIDGDIDFDINIREREYKSVTAAHTAWKAVRAAFKGTDELDQLRNDTLAYMAEDYGNKLGAIESFMDDSKSFIDGVDLQQMMYAEDGLKALENLNSYDLNISSTKTESIGNQPSPTISTTIIPGKVGAVDYSILKKGK